eukprot:10721232-Ditylum_brightwellii.AAC.1
MKKTQNVVKSNAKAVLLKLLLEGLFTPRDINNKEATSMLEVVGAIAIKATIVKLEDQKRQHINTIKESMIGKMVTNDLAESSFTGVTTQVQTFGHIDLCSADAVSGIARNGYLPHLTTKKELKKRIEGIFHTLPEELILTAIMVCMEDAPATKESNNKALSLQCQCRHEKEELVKQKGMENASDEYIEAMIYHQLCDSDVACKTVAD